MSNQVTLGGERLGTGKKQKVELHGYGRSTHDLSEVFRSTMSAGTLVPFMNIVGLPGDTFEIDLELDIKTHPTIGPLFGSYKAQLDVFVVPIRLYQGKMHMNLLNIGNKISEIKLPLIRLAGNDLNGNKEMTGQQVNPSALMRYLGVAGLGKTLDTENLVIRDVNAVPLLGYWDIYKNYYANKQEEIGMVLHNSPYNLSIIPLLCEFTQVAPPGGGIVTNQIISQDPEAPNVEKRISRGCELIMRFQTSTVEFDNDRIDIEYWSVENGGQRYYKMREIFEEVIWDNIEKTWTGRKLIDDAFREREIGRFTIDRKANIQGDVEPSIEKFELANIDKMRENILTYTSSSTAFKVEAQGLQPYDYMLDNAEIEEESNRMYSLTGNQEGLGLKTYLSDLFNNWINTEWIEGENGINEITAISTDNGQITIDEINLSTKIYKMLNRIAVSDGTFDSWIKATYDHHPQQRVETPIYVGGLFQELVFQEVISNTSVTDQPLGTLAGRGVMAGNEKGGHITVRVDEHSYIMGIVSLTPRIDYSQGNTWDINLKTMDDFHKPPLDEIGFQDLITEQMGFWETQVSEDGIINTRSAGKQPAWTNYMTSVNRTYGNFALENDQMFMTLNRRYGVERIGGVGTGFKIEDLTTYVDPAKYNNIFANTRRDGQNFWVQIGKRIKARRKMSAKVMPNL